MEWRPSPIIPGEAEIMKYLLLTFLLSCQEAFKAKDRRDEPELAFSQDKQYRTNICPPAQKAFKPLASLSLTGDGSLRNTIETDPMFKAFEKRLPKNISVLIKDIDQSPKLKTISALVLLTANVGNQKVPLCDKRFKFTKPGGASIKLSSVVPEEAFDWEVESDYTWPSEDLQGLSAKHELMPRTSEDASGGNLDIYKSDKCLTVADKKLIPTHRYRYRINDLNYEIKQVGSEFTEPVLKTLYLEGYFHAYDKSAPDTLQKYSTSKMQGDGNLCSDMFYTSVSADRQLAQSKDLTFLYEPGDQRFGEASTFIHAIQMQGFIESIGLKNWTTSGIKLLIATKGDLKYENPEMDSAASSTITPMVYLSPTLQSSLVRLDESFDVVAHEISHHYIFRYLDVTAGFNKENLALHEGLADSLMILASGDPCLGEFICVKNDPSGLCQVPGKCLRTADNDLVYGEEKYMALEQHHLKGQLVSAVVWDLYGKKKLSLELVSTILTESFLLLPRESSFTNFAEAIFDAASSISDPNVPDLPCVAFDILDKRGISQTLTSPTNCGTKRTNPLE
jgi:hypothetical protein